MKKIIKNTSNLLVFFDIMSLTYELVLKNKFIRFYLWECTQVTQKFDS